MADEDVPVILFVFGVMGVWIAFVIGLILALT